MIEPKIEKQESTLMVEIGKRISAKLKDKGWSQGEFAERTGYARKKVNKWVNGSTEINLSELEKVAKELSISLYELIGMKVEKFEVADPENPAYKAYKLLKGLEPEIQSHYFGVFYLIDQHEKKPNLNLSFK